MTTDSNAPGSASPGQPHHPQLAMPLFGTTEPVPPERVLKVWSRSFKGVPAPQVETSGEVVTYTTGDMTAVVIQIPAPVPGPEVMEALRSSWMWKEPPDAARNHRAHAIVAVSGGTPIEAAWTVARLSAALLKAGSGAALYWGNARSVHLPRNVMDFASARTIPIPLMVGVHVSSHDGYGPFSAATHGLAALGHKELEVLDTGMRLGQLRMTLYDLAGYVLANGPVLEEGQTFGPDAETVWSIHHRRGRLFPDRDVIVLGIP